MKNKRIAALIRFSVAITVLNIVGYGYLGFEHSYLHPVVAVCTAYTLELFFELLVAFVQQRKPAYLGDGIKNVILFLLPAHITGLAVSMLLYSNERLMPMVFATGVAIISKYLLRVSMNGRSRHFLNPSNAGIAVTLILFPWVGIAPPYQFTESFHGIGNWIFPLILIIAGTFLNMRYTGKMYLILGWFAGFLFQGVVRTLFFDASFIATLMPYTGIAFLLFTFYMISDPATTPIPVRSQVLFGFGVALIYGVLMVVHIVFGLFFALFIVGILRGSYYMVLNLVTKLKTEDEGVREKIPSLIRPAETG